MHINYPRDDRAGWRRWIPSWKLVLGSLASLAAAGAALFAVLFAVVYFTTDIPEVNEVAAAQTTIVYWNDGESEMARLGDTNRISVPLSEVPEDARYAVLSAEDRNFYDHHGFDVMGIARAMVNNLTSSSTSGGSTITQQLAKNAFLTSEQTIVRKFKEAVLTVKLEVERTKDEILEDYLNVIFYGRNSYGIQTASEAYFTTDAKDLTLEQGAVLASIINAPGLYNPDDPDGLSNLENRYEYVLNGMVEQGWLSAEKRDVALESFPDISARKKDQKFAGPQGHLLRAVQDELLAMGYTEDEIAGGGLRVVSTFEKKAQKAAEAAVADAGPTTGTEGLRIGLAAVQPVTGEVVAMYGGADYLENSLNNATQAIQQAGSTFKPFGLAAGIEDGIGLDSLWPGTSGTEVDGFVVNNYGNTSYGELISLLRGTEESVNTVYASLASETGYEAVKDSALRAGIPADTVGFDSETDITFVLGTDSPHTIDLARGYATFAARGQRAQTTTIRRVGTANGGLLYEREDNTQRGFDENTCDVVNYALQSVVTNGTGAPARALGRPVAAKTGSTDEYMSAWFAGYVPQLAAAVSFSKEDAEGNPISLSGTGGMTQFYGSGYPGRVWTAFMQGALKDVAVQDFVDPVDMPTGGGVQSPTPTPTPTTEKPTPKPTATVTPTPSPTLEPTPQPTPTPTPEPTQTPGPTQTPAPPSSPPATPQAP